MVPIELIHERRHACIIYFHQASEMTWKETFKSTTTCSVYCKMTSITIEEKVEYLKKKKKKIIDRMTWFRRFDGKRTPRNEEDWTLRKRGKKNEKTRKPFRESRVLRRTWFRGIHADYRSKHPNSPFRRGAQYWHAAE